MMNIKIQAEARSALYCSNLTYHLCAFDADFCTLPHVHAQAFHSTFFLIPIIKRVLQCIEAEK